MKKIKNTRQHRSFRRLVRQWFSGLLKRQDCNHRAEIRSVMGMLREIDESIEIIAREIARWARSDE